MKNQKQILDKENNNYRFFKILAAIFALIMFYTIIINPMDVIAGILDSLK